MNDNNKRIPNGIVFIMMITIFFLSMVTGYDIAENKYERKLREWAIEQEYVQYNSKTGELEVIDSDIDPIIDIIKKEDK